MDNQRFGSNDFHLNGGSREIVKGSVALQVQILQQFVDPQNGIFIAFSVDKKNIARLFFILPPRLPGL